MDRIKEKINQLKKINKKALVIYVTAGFPDPGATKRITGIIEEEGADMLELGMPFSDPIADGPTIQYSSYMALKKGMDIKKFFALVKDLRKSTQIPLIMMSYFNPIFKFGLKKFAGFAKKSGLDGVIIPDLPPEETGQLRGLLKKAGIHLIFLASPVSEDQRIKKISSLTSGFMYYVSLTGVTGTRKSLPSDLLSNLKRIKNICNKPVFVGFGISNPKQVKSISRASDGIIIGSAIIKIIEDCRKKNSDYAEKLKAFISSVNKMTLG